MLNASLVVSAVNTSVRMECLGFLSLRTSQLGRGGRKVSPPSDRWLVTIEFLVVCSSTTVGYEWDTSSLGYWFPSALSVYCWWCLGSPDTPSDHQEPWTALSIYPCVQVHEPWKAPLWRMCKHKVEGSPEEGKKLIQTSPKSNIRFPDILPLNFIALWDF